jgi:two-component system, NtrC family, nitrogen regulation sensor histidine kinase NtrY
VRLRPRFTISFALAALVPIAVAALVTRYVVARGYRQEHERTRVSAQQVIQRAVQQFQRGVAQTIDPEVLGAHHELTGAILRELEKGQLDANDLLRFKKPSQAWMHGLGLDLLLITGRGGRVLAAPHHEAMIDEDGVDRPETLARQTKGAPFFGWEQRMLDHTPEPILVAGAARFVTSGSIRVAVEVGREVDATMIDLVRREGRIDTRLVAADGRVLIAPAEPDWDRLAGDAPMRVPLLGDDGAVVAWVEIAVGVEALDLLLAQVTVASAALAAAALLLTVLLGVIVAHRMTRDLDRLVEGAQAAARGDLDHRVAASSRDEVGEVATAFNLMMEDLRAAKDRAAVAERIAAWQEVARRLAHEIKNPLTPIQMAMDTLRKTWRTQHPQFEEVLDESTATVLEEADRLKRIVSEFSEFARMPKPSFGPTDVGDVVASGLSLYQGAVPVERRLADGLPPIEADRGQLTQVLLNLLENARDAIATRGDDGGGRIIVTTRRGDAGDRVEIVVEDNGPGIAPEVRDRMFTPYFTTKQGKGGTGLGLAIVHRIVSDHGGRIVAGEAAGGGARFAVELPLRQGHALLASRI